jgi:hypothetical protein
LDLGFRSVGRVIATAAISFLTPSFRGFDPKGPVPWFKIRRNKASWASIAALLLRCRCAAVALPQHHYLFD